MFYISRLYRPKTFKHVFTKFDKIYLPINEIDIHCLFYFKRAKNRFQNNDKGNEINARYAIRSLYNLT